jgi:hypothetical protein
VTLEGLLQLANSGLVDTPSLREVTVYCWDQAVLTGDSRHCGLAQTFELILSRWDEDRALEYSLHQAINGRLKIHLPEILSTLDAAEAAGMARLLREEVSAILFAGGD